MVTARFSATGKRKSAVVRLVIEPGEGKITVNKRPMAEYFPRESWRRLVLQPLSLAGVVGQYNVQVNVSGGGLSGQAGAIRHGMSRALVSMNPELQDRLREAGLLTRDSRIKERKKYGRKGARRRFQYSKR